MKGVLALSARAMLILKMSEVRGKCVHLRRDEIH